jgi:hypothetical protein
MQELTKGIWMSQKQVFLCLFMKLPQYWLIYIFYLSILDDEIPDAQEMTPDAQKMPPDAQKMTPDAQEMIPDAQEMTPNAQEVTPNAQEGKKRTLDALEMTPDAQESKKKTPDALERRRRTFEAQERKEKERINMKKMLSPNSDNVEFSDNMTMDQFKTAVLDKMKSEKKEKRHKDGEEMIGREILKSFPKDKNPKKLFRGKVVSYDRKKSWFKVKYGEDSDVEHFNHAQLMKHLVN